MIFLASDVAEQVDASKSTSDQADGRLAEVEGEDGSNSENGPHDRNCVGSDPEAKRVDFVSLTSFTKGFEIPSLFACVINLTPPA